jgi:hypothetical protein
MIMRAAATIYNCIYGVIYTTGALAGLSWFDFISGPLYGDTLSSESPMALSAVRRIALTGTSHR